MNQLACCRVEGYRHGSCWSLARCHDPHPPFPGAGQHSLPAPSHARHESEPSSTVTVAKPLSTTAQLLLLTAAAQPDDAAIRRLLTDGVDWRELYNLAEHVRAAPIIVRHLGHLVTSAPDSGYQNLRQLATSSVMRMLQFEQLLHNTLRDLEQQGIEVMLLKGAGLAYTAYSSFPDRPMADLDLLVQPDKAERAWSHLQAGDWTWPEARWAAGNYTSHQHLPPLIQEPGGFKLELHTDLLPGGHPFKISANTLWESARRVPTNGRVLTVPRPLHQLWHVCVHFVWQHGMGQGSWRALRDSAAIVRRGDVAWPEFVDLARETRAETCCYWMLRLARRLAAADVPDHVLVALRPRVPEYLIEQLERHYVVSLFPSVLGCPSVWLTRRLWEAGIRPGASGHGRMRPWHVSERFANGVLPQEPESRRRTLWAKLGKIGGWAAYVLRTRRLDIPLNGPLSMHETGNDHT